MRKYSLGLKEEDSIQYNNTLRRGQADADDLQLSRIKVFEPTKSADNIVYYQVIGYDKEGEFRIKRRYSDFEALREAWKK